MCFAEKPLECEVCEKQTRNILSRPNYDSSFEKLTLAAQTWSARTGLVKLSGFIGFTGSADCSVSHVGCFVAAGSRRWRLLDHAVQS